MADPNHSQPSTSQAATEPNQFLLQVENTFQNVLKYENKTILQMAKSLIPLSELELKAIHRMRQSQQKIKEGDSKEHELSHPDALLIELMDWFKNSFFSWVDSPSCGFCESPTTHMGDATKLSGNETIRVEIFKCLLCEVITEFPRYNDPVKLLKTRKGRCGEWANCFMLFCRSLDYDTRLVVDTKDHVWTEVYSFDRGKWLHCDPCENVIDKPLLYEVGWGKKLEYVIGYSKDDIQDVTWRYTTNHKDVRKRRTHCTEQELIDKIIQSRDLRWRELTDLRKQFLRKRITLELLELMIERKPDKSDAVGRISGSLSWRLQRKETTPWTPHIFDFIAEKQIKITYCSALDIYNVYSFNDTLLYTISEWMNGAYEITDMFRKEEQDWKKVYLARSENSESGYISWRFSTSDDNLVIDSISIKTSFEVFETGSVKWEVSAGGQVYNVDKSKDEEFILKNLKCVNDFKVTAQVSGGTGDLAWQHAQLFRQSMKSKDISFQIIINFRQC